MKFCQKCGGIMVPKRLNNETLLVCIRCGYKQPLSKHDVSSYRQTTVIEHSEKDRTIVISEKDRVRGLPITKDVVCPKCGNHEAYYWTVQTRAADEPATRFFKCTKCGYVWREYD